MVLKPVRIFLDTRDLVYLSKVTADPALYVGRERAYAQVKRWMIEGVCTPLFYEPLAYEWLREGHLASAMELAVLYDNSANLLQVEPDPLIFILEALNGCRQVRPDLGIPQFEIVRQFSLQSPCADFLRQHLPAAQEGLTRMVVESPVRVPSTVKSLVKTLHAHIKSNDEPWRVAIDGFEESLRVTREDKASRSDTSRYSSKTILHWLVYQKRVGEILTSLDPEIDPMQVIQEIDLEACPATLLWVNAYDQYVRANPTMREDHDIIDVAFVPALAYADASLIEKRMRAYVHQGESGMRDSVFSDPVEFVQRVGAVVGLKTE